MRWRVTAAAAVIITVGAVIVRTQFLDTVSVTSNSMSPTVCTGDMLLLSREHGDDSARIGDIVTFPTPHDGGKAIKRVVAVAGQSVVIKDADLFVDGKPVVESLCRPRQHRRCLHRNGCGAGRDGVRDGRQPGDLHRLAGLRADSNGDHRRPAVAKTLVGMLTHEPQRSTTDPDSELTTWFS